MRKFARRGSKAAVAIAVAAVVLPRHSREGGTAATLAITVAHHSRQALHQSHRLFKRESSDFAVAVDVALPSPVIPASAGMTKP
jgi:hypothetical protein